MTETQEQISPEDFRVLGVEPGASPEVVKAAYISLVKTWHPDRYPRDSREKAEAEERLKIINGAYRRIRKGWHGQPKRSARDGPTKGDRDYASGGVERGGPRPARKRGRSSAARDKAQNDYSKPDAAFSGGKKDFLRAGLVLTAILLVIVWVNHSSISYWYQNLTFPSRINEAPPMAVDEHAPSKTVPETPSEPYDRAALKKLPPHVEPGAVVVEGGKEYFTLGSNMREVRRIQGEPSKVQGSIWIYDLSSIVFRDGKVWRYNNFDGTLKVRVLPSPAYHPEKPPTYFSIGSSKDEVLHVQGTPTNIEHNKWYYDFSQVFFKGGRVAGFTNSFNNLKIVMLPRPDAGIITSRRYFVVGSSEDEVLALQGTPTSVNGNLWSYQLSSILFQEGKVRSVSDISGNLLFVPPDVAYEKR